MRQIAPEMLQNIPHCIILLNSGQSAFFTELVAALSRQQLWGRREAKEKKIVDCRLPGNGEKIITYSLTKVPVKYFKRIHIDIANAKRDGERTRSLWNSKQLLDCSWDSVLSNGVLWYSSQLSNSLDSSQLSNGLDSSQLLWHSTQLLSNSLLDSAQLGNLLLLLLDFVQLFNGLFDIVQLGNRLLDSVQLGNLLLHSTELTNLLLLLLDLVQLFNVLLNSLLNFVQLFNLLLLLDCVQLGNGLWYTDRNLALDVRDLLGADQSQKSVASSNSAVKK
ncbi:hypothetical protein GEV33_000564 [Tenebrio molitor]|uniref:Uncharacterized protein n=1 Tax=Tenebrio molitor TaxID=7067 RepID=A0A8J6HX94_TENMO|nr:hypothetical protein GEV33_000564 [Tenebrio molitor]